MILHRLIQATHEESNQQTEQHLVLNKPAGDLDSGQEHWEVRPLGTWLAIEETGSKNCPQQDLAGLAVVMAMAGVPAPAYDLVQGQARVPVLPPDTKAQVSARRLDDKRVHCLKDFCSREWT